MKTWYYFIRVTFLRYGTVLSQLQSTKCSLANNKCFRKLSVQLG